MKKLYKYIVFIFFLFTTIDMIAQDFLVKGVVREKEGRQMTVPGVSVFVKDQKTKKYCGVQRAIWMANLVSAFRQMLS